jgi:hypothetical protein
LIDEYLEALLFELDETFETANKLGMKINTVYIGGGTPTTLDPTQLQRLLGKISEKIDVSEYEKLLNRTGTFEYDKEKGVITLLDQSEPAASITVEDGQDGGKTYTLHAGDLETVLTKEEAEESK